MWALREAFSSWNEVRPIILAHKRIKIALAHISPLSYPQIGAAFEIGKDNVIKLRSVGTV